MKNINFYNRLHKVKRHKQKHYIPQPQKSVDRRISYSWNVELHKRNMNKLKHSIPEPMKETVDSCNYRLCKSNRIKKHDDNARYRQLHERDRMKHLAPEPDEKAVDIHLLNRKLCKGVRYDIPEPLEKAIDVHRFNNKLHKKKKQSYRNIIDRQLHKRNSTQHCIAERLSHYIAKIIYCHMDKTPILLRRLRTANLMNEPIKLRARMLLIDDWLRRIIRNMFRKKVEFLVT